MTGSTLPDTGHNSWRRGRPTWATLDAEPLIYGTVIIMTVMVVGADDTDVDFGDATGMVLGPMVATAVAHLFSSWLGYVNSHHRMPGGADRRHLLWHSAHFLLLTVVPLIIIGLGRVSGLWSAYGALDTISDLAFLFLLVLGAASGWHASKRRWRGAILGGLVAIVVGLIVTVLKVVLEH